MTGIDLSPVQVDRARADVPTGTFLVGDMCSLELPDASVDAVVSFYAMIHVPVEEQRSLLDCIARWLVPGGHFMATLGAKEFTGIERDWLGVPGATMFWSHADAPPSRRWLQEAGFEVLSDEFVPEGSEGHQLFHARRMG